MTRLNGWRSWRDSAMPGISLVCLKPDTSLDCQSMSITIASFSSGNDLRSTDGPGLDEIRHHLASEAFKRGTHALSLECSKVWQDHEVVHASSFKLPDAATHLLGVTKQDESCCLQFDLVQDLGIHRPDRPRRACQQPSGGCGKWRTPADRYRQGPGAFQRRSLPRSASPACFLLSVPEERSPGTA